MWIREQKARKGENPLAHGKREWTGELLTRKLKGDWQIPVQVELAGVATVIRAEGIVQSIAKGPYLQRVELA